MNPPNSSQRPVRTLLFGTFLLAVFIVVLGMATVWMQVQISSSASRRETLEQRRTELTRRTEELQGQIAMLMNPEVLQRHNREFGLGLVPTDEPQVVRVTESVTRRLAAKRNREILIASPLRAPGEKQVADGGELIALPIP